MAEETFEAGRISLAQNSRELGIDLLMQSLHIHEQVYSVIHPEVARLYVALSNIYYSLEDRATAVELAKKAVVIAERTMGLDSLETIQAYINLALFEHSVGHSGLALRYLIHATDLQKIVWGSDHPDFVNVINNGAVMLQGLRKYAESREWFEHCAALSPAPSVSRASILFQLSQALTLEKNIHGAVNRMRESASMFRSLLGPDDRSTKEAENWLEQLTTNAVNLAKRQKDLSSGRLKRVSFVNPSGSITGPGDALKTNGSAITNRAASKDATDQRNIDDLIKYIEGGKDATMPAQSKKAGAKRGGNPKRRGGAKAGGS
jgi:protein TIF31